MGIINCKYCNSLIMGKKKHEKENTTQPPIPSSTRRYLQEKLERRTIQKPPANRKPAKATQIVPEILATEILEEIEAPGAPGKFSLTNTGQLNFTPTTPSERRQQRLQQFQKVTSADSPWYPYTASV